MPWMPWSAAVYDYNSLNESKYDPEGYCLPPGGPRMMATPYQMEIIQLPEHKRIMMIFEGATHIWREIYMDGRKFPEGDALNPTYLGLLGRPLGRRHARRREQGLQREQLVRLLRPPAHRPDVGGRALDAAEQADAALRGHGHRSGRLHAAVHDRVGHPVATRSAELPEYICQENNQYLNRLVDDFGQPIFGPRPQPGQKPPAARGTQVAMMRALHASSLALAALVTLPAIAGAQFGHPLKGQWSGEWGPRASRTACCSTSSGTARRSPASINPGPNAATVKSVTFDYTQPVGVGREDDGRGQGRVRQGRADPRGRQAREHRRLPPRCSTAPGCRAARRASSR